MITPGWATRLQTVFGVPLEEVTEEHLQHLVDDGVREHTDLDFKQCAYDNGDKQRVELAADIAQFANDRGGVIVIGVREDKGIAVELLPVSLDIRECDRMQSIASERVVPYAQFEPRPVPSKQDQLQGYYLLIVPPSPDRPHAVRNGKDLRYPRRNGTQKRWLAESEIADAYRDRFTRTSADVNRVDQLVRDGLALVERNEDFPYLVVGLVPSQRASFQVDAANVKLIEEWAGQRFLYDEDHFSGPFMAGRRRAGVGVRRILLGTAGGYGLDTSYGYMEVHADGSAFASTRIEKFISHRPPGLAHGEADERKFPTTALTLRVASCLRAAACASLEVGAFGDCAVIVELHGDALRLIEPSGDYFEQPVGDKAIDGPLASRHTLTLESLTSMSAELLIATRQVCADLIQAFGGPELTTITPDGHLRLTAFPSGYHQPLTAWSEQTDIPLIR